MQSAVPKLAQNCTALQTPLITTIPFVPHVFMQTSNHVHPHANVNYAIRAKIKVYKESQIDWTIKKQMQETQRFKYLVLWIPVWSISHFPILFYIMDLTSYNCHLIVSFHFPNSWILVLFLIQYDSGSSRSTKSNDTSILVIRRAQDEQSLSILWTQEQIAGMTKIRVHYYYYYYPESTKATLKNPIPTLVVKTGFFFFSNLRFSYPLPSPQTVLIFPFFLPFVSSSQRRTFPFHLLTSAKGHWNSMQMNTHD